MVDGLVQVGQKVSKESIALSCSINNVVVIEMILPILDGASKIDNNVLELEKNGNNLLLDSSGPVWSRGHFPLTKSNFIPFKSQH